MHLLSVKAECIVNSHISWYSEYVIMRYQKVHLLIKPLKCKCEASLLKLYIHKIDFIIRAGLMTWIRNIR